MISAGGVADAKIIRPKTACGTETTTTGNGRACSASRVPHSATDGCTSCTCLVGNSAVDGGVVRVGCVCTSSADESVAVGRTFARFIGVSANDSAERANAIAFAHIGYAAATADKRS